MGSGWKDWALGEVVTEGEFQGYLQDQVIFAFATAAARDAAITSPTEGMHAYLADVKETYRYNGAAWLSIDDLFVKQVLADAKGDLIAASGADTFVRVPVGTNGQVLQADSSQAAGLSWVSGGTDRAVLGGFSMQDSIISTATQLQRILRGTSGATLQYRPVVVDRAGSIVGLAISGGPRTGGTMTVEVYKNAVATGLTAVLDATNTTYAYAVQAAGLDTFVAGDRLDCRATEASWNDILQPVEAAITVQYS